MTKRLEAKRKQRNPMGVVITRTPESCAVHVGIPPRVAASADNMGDHWWVSRVFVHADHRNKGLGAFAVQALKAAVRLQGGTELRVMPGGYGSDLKDLARFYERQGFVKQEQEEQWVCKLSESFPCESHK